MTTHTNEYENAGNRCWDRGGYHSRRKEFPMIDEALAWPLIYRTDPFELYDDPD